ncbi:MAG: hypothetical protein K9J37_08955 [Saprospiraceae bacterium]|nr:hypothetical protein [Saprospiraceae bacterium]MCF8250030.1 hypothetical protein [Saprospiraceae bacterium]MCF8278930.1 hypothetical protein [Bacteroidales bacterium]MCF8311043.1 hypothetical protein [Saprospiraceae bacterium]MCF8439621.1 hypothetical protein [Saprospiraceae bacterium]
MKRKCLYLLVFLGLFTSFVRASKPEQVLTGVYLMNLYDLNLDENSFYADFYVWFKWKGEIDPTGIEFVNMVEKWGMTQEPFEDTIILLDGGWKYQGFRVEGRFFHPFELQRFPLDRHPLELHLEHPDYPARELVFVKDTTSSPIYYRPELALAGWELLGAELLTKTHNYETDFGNPDNPAINFSNFVFRFSITRPVSYFVLKLLLPLTVVIFAALGALLFFPSYVDARISLPVGSLLTAVFLQQSYADALPDVGYMVLMDKIYLLAYGLIAAVMFQLILTGNKLQRFKKKELDLHQLKIRERKMAAFFLAVYLTATLLLVFFD